ncbi:hypothetical protein HMPREF9140_01054 [Prevotella micans F0438]|uniref:Uncharacterized protein n=1 Tax=Prevotella micans F0438 TaxID=883158 RepID=H1Q2B6_9BACT|nr:hypothetical protein HMPREF9140_01054 [Prevotella micans F0438]
MKGLSTILNVPNTRVESIFNHIDHAKHSNGKSPNHLEHAKNASESLFQILLSEW